MDYLLATFQTNTTVTLGQLGYALEQAVALVYWRGMGSIVAVPFSAADNVQSSVFAACAHPWDSSN